LVTPDEMRASNQEYDRRQNTGNLDTTPLTAKSDSKSGRMEPDKGYTSPSRGAQAKDYMSKEDMDEAKYQGREVPLGKKMAGDVKKSKVYVRKPNGNIVKVNFGDKKMRIKKSNPARRKSFRARHNCANPGPRHKARYWSCRSW
jgi:N-acetylmuramoyl-L-alanine amidase CwlA